METTKRDRELEVEVGKITPHELANMIDAGLSPVIIDRLRFTRWRMRKTIADRRSVSNESPPSTSPGKTAPRRTAKSH